MLWWKRGSRPYIKGFLNTFTTKSLIFQEITVWRLMIILCFSSILTRCYWMLRLSLALARIPSYIQQLQSSKNSAEVSFSSTYSQPWILSPLIHQCSSLSSLASFMTFFFLFGCNRANSPCLQASCPTTCLWHSTTCQCHHKMPLFPNTFLSNTSRN